MILAGGEGRRIGGGKPLRQLARRPLIEHALERARAWSDVIALSVREPGQFALGDVPLLVDEQGSGPVSGIAAALHLAATHALDGILTIPCDTPFLPRDLPVVLTRSLRPDTGVAVPVSGGRSHPSCALWRSGCAGALPAYLASGSSSLKGFAAQVGIAKAFWPSEPFDPFFNINTEEDLAVAEALIKKR